MGWLRATYLTVGSFINFLFAIALVASAYAYIIPPDKMIFASYLGLAFPVLLAANIIFISVSYTHLTLPTNSRV